MTQRQLLSIQERIACLEAVRGRSRRGEIIRQKMLRELYAVLGEDGPDAWQEARDASQPSRPAKKSNPARCGASQ